MRRTMVLVLSLLAASCYNLASLSHSNDGGTGTDGGAGSDGGGCPAGTLRCKGACVPSDSTNCGACGNACAAPTTECNGATCTCPGGGLVCGGGMCIANDESNCGMCGNVCAQGTYCDDVACQSPWAGWPMPNPTGSVDPKSGAMLPNQASYDTSVAGVVTDNVTHLMWQRAVSLQTFPWANAKSYCAGLSLAGHDDWRLPTDIELVSLVDFTKYGPAIDSVAFPNTPNGEFWTSSPFVGDPTWAWYIDFNVGNTYYWNVTDQHYARCVR